MQFLRSGRRGSSALSRSTVIEGSVTKAAHRCSVIETFPQRPDRRRWLACRPACPRRCRFVRLVLAGMQDSCCRRAGGMRSGSCSANPLLRWICWQLQGLERTLALNGRQTDSGGAIKRHSRVSFAREIGKRDAQRKAHRKPFGAPADSIPKPHSEAWCPQIFDPFNLRVHAPHHH